MRSDKCDECQGWAEPPFNRTIEFNAPVTREDLLRFLRGEECNIVRISRPLCRYCAHAMSHGADYLTEEGKDALDLSDEG